MSPFLIAVFVLLVIYKLYRFIYDKPPNTPPGIPRVPIGGGYWLLLWRNYNFPHKAVEYYMKKLKSKIISCYFGDYFAIIANDYLTIKEILTREEFDGRVTAPFLEARAFGKKLGMFFIDGQQWHEQRRFALRHMRDFGFGRRQENLENVIMSEMSLFIDILKYGPVFDGEKEIMKGNLALFPDVLYASAGNSIWNIMFGEIFDRKEHNIPRHLCRSAMILQRAADTTGGSIFQRPFLKHFGNLFGYADIMKGNYAIVDVIKEHLKYQKETHDDYFDRGFVDKYISKMKESNVSSHFTDEQLIIMLVDIMFPALSAVPTVITHAIKYLMHNPNIMKKAQAQIDEVVGTGRLVTWEDRTSLPYIEAIVRETLRIETLTPFSVFHRSTKDTTLAGYVVRANTPIVTNLSALNHDVDLWGDPENFRPERFLGDDGKLIKDFTLPFGFGHRVCAGETYARYNLFEVTALLLQNFNFFFVKGEPSGLEDKLPGLIVTPKDLWIRLETRR